MSSVSDGALGAVFAEFGRIFTLTPPGGTPVAVTVLYWERPGEGALNSLSQPHAGPVAEFRVSDLSALGLSEVAAGAQVASDDGRSFTVRRAPRSRSGLLLVAELDEAP